MGVRLGENFLSAVYIDMSVVKFPLTLASIINMPQPRCLAITLGYANVSLLLEGLVCSRDIPPPPHGWEWSGAIGRVAVFVLHAFVYVNK